MTIFSLRRATNLKVGYLMLLVVLLALIISLVASYSIRKSRSALLEVMSQQGESLIEALVLAGENIVSSQSVLEEAVEDKTTPP
jgi:hypothetical protein